MKPPYRDRGTMGLPVWMWPVMHPMQNLRGRGVGIYGVMQVGKPTPPWWRYPVTYVVCRFWYHVPMFRQTEESLAALRERLSAMRDQALLERADFKASLEQMQRGEVGRVARQRDDDEVH